MKSLFLFTFTIASFACAQEEFSFRLYFEDSLGNKDTIIVGYDENATNGIDTNFGEVNIAASPWNNSFEVRTGNGFMGETDWPINNTFSDFQSKKQIKFKDCLVGQRYGIPIIVKINTPPLEISWDIDNDFFTNDTCRHNSQLKNQPNFFSDVAHKSRFLRSDPPFSDGYFEFDQVDLDFSFSTFEDKYTIWLYIGNNADYHPEIAGVYEDNLLPKFNIIGNSFIVENLESTSFNLSFYDFTGHLILESYDQKTDISALRGLFIVHYKSNKTNITRRFYK
jgi:hypothetical protein